ncbi:MAG: hypothetical protein WAM39_06405 [Bryobacteraceae bacterium]
MKKGGRGKNLPDEDHVMRYVPWTRLLKDEDENVLGFLPQAFQLRPEEDYLSVNWLQYYDGNRDTQIRLSVWAIRDTFEKPLGAKSAFAIGNVAQVKKIFQACGSRVRIVHEPVPKNPGHSGIRQLPRDDLTLLEALASDAFTERVNNIDIQLKPAEPPSSEI